MTLVMPGGLPFQLMTTTRNRRSMWKPLTKSACELPTIGLAKLQLMPWCADACPFFSVLIFSFPLCFEDVLHARFISLRMPILLVTACTVT